VSNYTNFHLKRPSIGFDYGFSELVFLVDTSLELPPHLAKDYVRKLSMPEINV
jgi:hypothetical protein